MERQLGEWLRDPSELEASVTPREGRWVEGSKVLCGLRRVKHVVMWPMSRVTCTVYPRNQLALGTQSPAGTSAVGGGGAGGWSAGCVGGRSSGRGAGLGVGAHTGACGQSRSFS